MVNLGFKEKKRGFQSFNAKRNKNCKKYSILVNNKLYIKPTKNKKRKAPKWVKGFESIVI